MAINCAAIPADLLEAEMFGIGKGIATGVLERQGKFQDAQAGTLFLDEIGDMSLDLQAKLLRALQEKEIQPVGGAPVAVDIRVLTATNTDLLRNSCQHPSTTLSRRFESRVITITDAKNTLIC